MVMIEHVFAGIPVSDRAVAVEWYERLFGRAPDLIPNDREAAWRLTETGWVYVVEEPARAGSAWHTLLVGDLDGFLGDAAGRGILIGDAETIAPGVRRSMIGDPDGNRVAVGQAAG